jgi:hypothetical protein
VDSPLTDEILAMNQGFRRNFLLPTMQSFVEVR